MSDESATTIFKVIPYYHMRIPQLPYPIRIFKSCFDIGLNSDTNEQTILISNGWSLKAHFIMALITHPARLIGSEVKFIIDTIGGIEPLKGIKSSELHVWAHENLAPSPNTETLFRVLVHKQLLKMAPYLTSRLDDILELSLDLYLKDKYVIVTAVHDNPQIEAASDLGWTVVIDVDRFMEVPEQVQETPPTFSSTDPVTEWQMVKPSEQEHSDTLENAVPVTSLMRGTTKPAWTLVKVVKKKASKTPVSPPPKKNQKSPKMIGLFKGKRK